MYEVVMGCCIGMHVILVRLQRNKIIEGQSNSGINMQVSGDDNTWAMTVDLPCVVIFMLFYHASCLDFTVTRVS